MTKKILVASALAWILFFASVAMGIEPGRALTYGFLRLTGGTMSGDIDMGDNVIVDSIDSKNQVCIGGSGGACTSAWPVAGPGIITNTLEVLGGTNYIGGRLVLESSGGTWFDSYLRGVSGVLTLGSADCVSGESLGLGDTCSTGDLELQSDLYLASGNEALFRGSHLSEWRRPVTEHASNHTVTVPDDCGTTQAATADGVEFTLPDAGSSAEGCEIVFQNRTAAQGDEFYVDPVDTTETVRGGCIFSSWTGVAGQGAGNSGVNTYPGHFIRLTHDGSNTWYITGCQGTWSTY